MKSALISKFFYMILLLLFMLNQSLSVSAEVKTEELITIDFVDANIHDVIRVLAAAKKMNFLVGDEVAGKVTIFLDNVTLETALDAVVLSKGYLYRIKENFLWVDKVEKFAEEEENRKKFLDQEQLITHVFSLKYINGNDIIELLKTQLSPRGTVMPLVETLPGRYSTSSVTSETGGTLSQNQRESATKKETVEKVIVIDVVETLTKVNKLLAELDVMPVQILIESKLVESVLDDKVDLGIRWDVLGGDQGLKVGFTDVSKTYVDKSEVKKEYGISDQVTRSITADGEADIPEYIRKDYFNVNPRDIFNTKTYDPDSGEEISPFSYSISRTLGQTSDDSFINSNFSTNFENLATATLSAQDFNIVLNALKSKGDLDIISNPSIVTLNDHEASILIGEKYPILKSSTSDAGTTVQTFDHFEPVGIQLQVLPRVLPDQFVSMVIKPSVTSIGAPVGSAELLINRINTREASTRLIVKSGDTIVIGGLVSEEGNKSNSSIPFLGKLPLIGKLFSHKSIKNNKVNLTVFVTPTIIKN